MKQLTVGSDSIDQIIATTCQVLLEGGLVIFPTETTYGAGVDATNQDAVDTLLAYKSRREGKPLSIAVPDKESAAKYVDINDQAEALYDQFLPGPVTIVSKYRSGLANGVASEFGTVGVRIPDYPLMLTLLSAFGKPITATSANASGKKRPYSISDIFSSLSSAQKNRVALVIDAGELPHNEPSTVIDTTLSTPLTIRKGSATLEKDQPVQVFTSQSEQETKNLAGKLLLKEWNTITEKGLLITLDGPLGAGKTIFTKGVAAFLQLTDTITSPTYSYQEEYPYKRHQTEGTLYHFDLWKIEEEEQLMLLEIDKCLRPGNVIVIEWYSQVAHFAEMQRLVAIIPHLHCQIAHPLTSNQSERQLEITDTIL